ncbi:MAG: hypothetical protein WAN47_10815 [Nitrosotalea sp.]
MALCFLGSTGIPNVFAQSITNVATLLIYTDVPWQGNIGTSSNSTSINGNTYAQYSFVCNYNDTYSITLQSAESTGRGIGIWTVANLIQDDKMIDMAVNRVANGIINLSGQCHVAKFSMANNGMVSFSTDKTTYQYGEPIRISGETLPDFQRNYVLSITILNSDGLIMKRDSTLVRDNIFQDYVTAHGGLWKPGKYKIQVQIANSMAETDITINSVQQGQSTTTSENHIPSWIKNTAKWWSDGSISNSEFIQTIQYLIQQGTLKIPNYYSNSITTQSLLPWIKNNAALWANGQISDDDFVKVLQYLNIQ